MRHEDIRPLIRAEMLEHALRHPLLKPLAAKQIRARHPGWPLSTIYWHMSEIRREADRTVSWKDSNSGPSKEASS